MLRRRIKCAFTCRFYRIKAGDYYGYNGKRQDFIKNDWPYPYVLESEQALNSLINAYRTHGFKAAKLDPLRMRNIPIDDVPELDPHNHGLLNCSKEFNVSHLLPSAGTKTLSVTSLVDRLNNMYCGPISAEYMHISDWRERMWFAEQFEKLHEVTVAGEEKLKLAELLLKSQNLDHYLASKFPTTKRYSAEGAESMMVFFWKTIKECYKYNITDVFIASSHRGRVNLLALILNFPLVQIFRKMRGLREFPANIKPTGDILPQIGASAEISTSHGSCVNVSLLPNPSHLEAPNPVAVGMARGRQMSLRVGDYASILSQPNERVLCVQVHGDASFNGQGIVQETLQMSQCPNFRIGGSLHFIINNQVGCTSEANTQRSSSHTSDIAKSIDSPIIHVNGDYPEFVTLASRLALYYRQTFFKDVFINMFCYRRLGHNELDNPSLTQPIMYDVIQSKQTTPDMYAQQLIKEGILTAEQQNNWIQDHNNELNANLEIVDSTPPLAANLTHHWRNLSAAWRDLQTFDTGVDVDTLKFVGGKSVTGPCNMTIHEQLQENHCVVRLKRLQDGTVIDWSTAEAMAFGSFLLEGVPVRISGEDVGRGTFSQRNVMLVDRKTDQAFVPLNYISENQKAFLEVANSLLSEQAVLGFEYGMSVENPKRLVIWEAFFGDFSNGAQTIIDTFVTSGEGKWSQQSGLVMSLPHGYDGQGAEHSSCRPERWLQLCDSSETQIDTDDVNMCVVQPTTAAQYFHLLRLQMQRPFRKPLIIFSPKLPMLRHPSSASNLSDFVPGTHFQPVIGDSSVSADKVTKVILCSGKHAFALQAEREKRNLAESCAIVRLEAICPFPGHQLAEEINKYSTADKIIWAQEEPRNMGCWSFVSKRCEQILGAKLQYAGRPELSMVATAIGELHAKEIEKLMDMTFS